MAECPPFSLGSVNTAYAAPADNNNTGTSTDSSLRIQGKYTQPDPKYVQSAVDNGNIEDTSDFEDWNLLTYKNKEGNLQAIFSLKTVKGSHLASKKVYALNPSLTQYATVKGYTVVQPPPPSNQPGG